MKYKIQKDHSGKWFAETNIMLDEVKRLELRITTINAGRGKVSANGSVHVVSEDGRSYTHMMFQDYNKNIFVKEAKRVTEKVIEEIHNSIDFVEVIADAKKHYGLT